MPPRKRLPKLYTSEDFLVAWLNGAEPRFFERDGRKSRIVGLIRLLRKFQDQLDSYLRLPLKDRPVASNALAELENRISRNTRRYRGQIIFFRDRGEEEGQRPRIRDGFGWAPHAGSLEELQAMMPSWISAGVEY